MQRLAALPSQLDASAANLEASFAHDFNPL
jgi:hypothetical protein